MFLPFISLAGQDDLSGFEKDVERYRQGAPDAQCRSIVLTIGPLAGTVMYFRPISLGQQVEFGYFATQIQLQSRNSTPVLLPTQQEHTDQLLLYYRLAVCGGSLRITASANAFAPVMQKLDHRPVELSEYLGSFMSALMSTYKGYSHRALRVAQVPPDGTVPEQLLFTYDFKSPRKPPRWDVREIVRLLIHQRTQKSLAELEQRLLHIHYELEQFGAIVGRRTNGRPEEYGAIHVSSYIHDLVRPAELLHGVKQLGQSHARCTGIVQSQ